MPKFHFSLVAPERELYAGEVDQVDAPGMEGDFGKIAKLPNTIRSFKAICDGQYDHLPEAAFYMVGKIEGAAEKAEKLAAGA